MSVFHIDKTPVAVKVWTTDGDVEGFVHLSPCAKSHSGTETVLDLMTAEEPFLPVTTDQRTALFSKSCIMAIWYEVDLDRQPVAAVERHGEIYLRGRRPLRVMFRDERPPDKERVSDFLNDGCPFIITHHQGSHVLLAKQHLIQVVPTAAAPASPAPSRPSARRGARKAKANGKATRKRR